MKNIIWKDMGLPPTICCALNTEAGDATWQSFNLDLLEPVTKHTTRHIHRIPRSHPIPSDNTTGSVNSECVHPEVQKRRFTHTTITPTVQGQA